MIMHAGAEGWGGEALFPWESGLFSVDVKGAYLDASLLARIINIIVVHALQVLRDHLFELSWGHCGLAHWMICDTTAIPPQGGSQSKSLPST